MPNCVIVIGCTFKMIWQSHNSFKKYFFSLVEKWAMNGKQPNLAGAFRLRGGKMLLNSQLEMSGKMEVNYLAGIDCWDAQWRPQSAKSCHRLLKTGCSTKQTTYLAWVNVRSGWKSLSCWHSIQLRLLVFLRRFVSKQRHLNKRTWNMTDSRAPTEPRGITSVSPLFVELSSSNLDHWVLAKPDRTFPLFRA